MENAHQPDLAAISHPLASTGSQRNVSVAFSHFTHRAKQTVRTPITVLTRSEC